MSGCHTEFFNSRQYTVSAFRVGPSKKLWEIAGELLGGATGAFNGHLPELARDRCWYYIDCGETYETAMCGDWVVIRDGKRQVMTDAEFSAQFHVSVTFNIDGSITED